MSRKRVRWLVAVLFLVGIALASFWWFYLRPPYGITKRSFDKIEPGMTLREVEAIIGEPGTNFLTIRVFHGGPRHVVDGERDGEKDHRHWLGPSITTILTVYLDANGMVLAKEYTGPEATDVLSRLLEMLGL
jgi:HAMP domain-containing protein